MKHIIMGLYACMHAQATIVANWIYVNSKVLKIGTGWKQDKACIHLENGEVIKVDLTTTKGKAEFSLAIVAKTTGKMLNVGFDLDGDLTGYCNTGINVRPHGIIVLVE